jgi:hypothetical protein
MESKTKDHAKRVLARDFVKFQIQQQFQVTPDIFLHLFGNHLQDPFESDFFIFTFH